MNAVLGLAVLLVIGGASPAGSVILVLLTLAQGSRLSLFEAGAAVAVVTLVSLIAGLPTNWILLSVGGVWIPTWLLATNLLATRSLTLAMQVAVIVAIAGMTGFMIAVSDPAAFWQPYLDWITEVSELEGMEQYVEVLTPNIILWMMVLSLWFLSIIPVCLGNAWYASLPWETGNMGRFRELNYGRVIASTTLLLSVVGPLTGWLWALNVASFLFVAFVVQGLAVMHWLRAKENWPILVLVTVYVLTLVIPQWLVVALGLLGYIDAWINVRGRWEKSKGSRT